VNIFPNLLALISNILSSVACISSFASLVSKFLFSRSACCDFSGIKDSVSTDSRGDTVG
jgi:hypothetical protein